MTYSDINGAQIVTRLQENIKKVQVHLQTELPLKCTHILRSKYQRRGEELRVNGYNLNDREKLFICLTSYGLKPHFEVSSKLNEEWQPNIGMIRRQRKCMYNLFLRTDYLGRGRFRMFKQRRNNTQKNITNVQGGYYLSISKTAVSKSPAAERKGDCFSNSKPRIPVVLKREESPPSGPGRYAIRRYEQILQRLEDNWKQTYESVNIRSVVRVLVDEIQFIFDHLLLIKNHLKKLAEAPVCPYVRARAIFYFYCNSLDVTVSVITLMTKNYQVYKAAIDLIKLVMPNRDKMCMLILSNIKLLLNHFYLIKASLKLMIDILFEDFDSSYNSLCSTSNISGRASKIIRMIHESLELYIFYTRLFPVDEQPTPEDS